ncbi:zinc-dependent alcohol dehydrogenase family protein [Cupriavidus metallidurans]|uniref:zinc-dependent alcohol dehydrogenase family protein n=1 Tax=Cupriavidus metallidurans TaxID=119219 RepID=UPI000B28AEE0|nr:zinc-dependent alcohol dehydrogenase family protein [Cupriavidus metallidurans]
MSMGADLSSVRVVRFHQLGGPEVLQIETMRRSALGSTDVRVAVKALALNRADAMFRRGQYIETAKLPSTLGYEAAGVVIEVGDAVTDLLVGDAVCVVPQLGASRHGSYADELVVPQQHLVLKPARLSFAEAAAAWMQYLTPYGALVEIADLGQGDTVLITAASSSVGLGAIQIAKLLGAIPIATTLTRDKKSAVMAAGAAHVIATEEESLLGRLQAIVGENGLRAAFDAVGGPQLADIAEVMSPMGVLIVHGALSPEPTLFPLKTALRKSLSVRGYVFSEVVGDAERLARACRFILDGLACGALNPVIDRSFAFDDIVAAHRYLESNQQIGKIVVTL